MRLVGPLSPLLAGPARPDPATADVYGKLMDDVDAAVDVVRDGAAVMVGGFGGAGFPFALRDALARKRRMNLTVIANNGDFGQLAYDGGLRRLICSYPTGPSGQLVAEQIEAGNVELLITPQGTFVEQIRARAAGLGGILTPTGVGTELAERFQIVSVEGRDYVLAPALSADVALVRAAVADTAGNLSCRLAARNFNPIMAMAASYTIAQVNTVVAVGELDPDLVHVPSPFVDRIVIVPDETQTREKAARG